MKDEYDDIEQVQLITDANELKDILRVQCKLLDKIRIALEKLVYSDPKAHQHMVGKDKEVVEMYRRAARND